MALRRNSVRTFKKLESDTTELSKVQQNIENAFTPLLRNPIVDGVLLEDICLKPETVNEVLHKLDRKPLGFLIVRKRSDSRIWDVQDSNPSPTQTFSICASHEVVVDIYIF